MARSCYTINMMRVALRCCSTQVWLEEVLGWYSEGIWVTSHIPLSQDGALIQPSNTPATVTGNQADHFEKPTN